MPALHPTAVVVSVERSELDLAVTTEGQGQRSCANCGCELHYEWTDAHERSQERYVATVYCYTLTLASVDDLTDVVEETEDACLSCRDSVERDIKEHTPEAWAARLLRLVPATDETVNSRGLALRYTEQLSERGAA